MTSTDPNLFQSPFRAGIRIDAYQLEPLAKALRLPRVNLFIADDVGLGKTIEAGLIARELLLRKKVQDIVVACPPSMLLQWQDELEDRFGLVFQILDKDYIARVRRERGYGVNPWTTHSRFLVSHRLLIDEAYTGHAARLARRLPARLAAHPRRGPPRRPVERREVRHRLEDHPGRPRPGRAVRAPAVPVGHAAQRPLQQLLRPAGDPRPAALLPGRAGPGKKLLDDVMVRRLKEDLRAVAGGFPKRIVRQIDIDGLPPDTPELRLSVLLDQYRELREERLKGETKRKQATAGLADLRAAAAAALLGRGVRPDAPRPPPDGGAALGSGRGRTARAEAARRHAARSSPRASTTTTTGPRSPRRSSRPRKRPRSRRPRGTRRPPGPMPSPARSNSSTR